MAKIVITMAGLFALSFVLSVVAILTAAWLFYQPMPSHERNAVEQPQAVEPAKDRETQGHFTAVTKKGRRKREPTAQVIRC
jgi:hypothetical protein